MTIEQIEQNLRKTRVELIKATADLETVTGLKEQLKASIEASISSAKFDETEINAKEEQVTTVLTDLQAKQEKVEELNATIADFESKLATKQTETQANIIKKGSDTMKDRILANLLLEQDRNPNFTLSAEATAIPGITKEGREVEFETDKVLVDELNQTSDLRKYVTVKKTNKGSVDEVIPASVTNRAYRAAELTKNKQLERGTITERNVPMETLRGATTMSMEYVEDNKTLGVDDQIKQEFADIEVNTANFLISEKWDTFPAGELTSIVDVQKALSHGVPAKYAPQAVINEAFLAEIQGVQYADGRFAFIPSANSAFEGYLFGHKVNVEPNETLGTADPVLYLVGKKAVCYYDRKKVTGEFLQNEHYGKDLFVVIRGAVSKWYNDGGKKYTLALTSKVVEVPETGE